GLAEDLDKVPYQRHGFALVSRVVVHLPAASLPHREFHLMPQPLQQAHHRLPCPREKRVVEAGDEKRYTHRCGVPGRRCVRGLPISTEERSPWSINDITQGPLAGGKEKWMAFPSSRPR